MMIHPLRLLSLLLIGASSLSAQELPQYARYHSPVSETESSSVAVEARTGAAQASPVVRTTQLRPFRTWGVGLNVATTGIGFQAATPLSNHLNLRMGATFFGVSTTIDDDGWRYDASFALRNGQVQVDYFPFQGALGFHVSPGIAFHHNGGQAAISVAAGQRFNLGDGTYTSSPTDPVKGLATFNYEHHVAPMLTAGFGNMIPRNGRRWSIPIELGVIFTGTPRFGLNIDGTVCDSQGCGRIATDADAQRDLAKQRTEVQDNINSYARVYPIFSVGFAWNFGPR